MRAVYGQLPREFALDSDGKKKQWYSSGVAQ
jgi:hypothetical protein